MAGWIAACGWCQVRVGSECEGGVSCATPAQTCIDCPGIMTAEARQETTCLLLGSDTASVALTLWEIRKLELRKIELKVVLYLNVWINICIISS